MEKIVYITEEQERELVDKYLKESLVVNSAQVSDIVGYLNKFYEVTTNYAGDVGIDGLMCPTMCIIYKVNDKPLQQLKREELLDVLTAKFQGFVKDELSRRTYFNQIIEDWINGNKQLQKTGQLSVNTISDDMIKAFKNKQQSLAKKKKNDSDDGENDKDTEKK